MEEDFNYITMKLPKSSDRIKRDMAVMIYTCAVLDLPIGDFDENIKTSISNVSDKAVFIDMMKQDLEVRLNRLLEIN